MRNNPRHTTAIIAILAATLTVTATSAFVITNTLPRSSASSAAARAPGQMVNAGAGRHQARLNDFASQPEITETAPPSFEAIFQEELAGAIEVIFGEVNQAVELLINILFIRAGQDPPFLPQLPDIPDPNDNNNEMESNQNGEQNNAPTEKSRLSLTQRSMLRIPTSE